MRKKRFTIDGMNFHQDEIFEKSVEKFHKQINGFLELDVNLNRAKAEGVCRDSFETIRGF
jgi:hypothetical protein